MEGCVALPLVEKESKATRGRTSKKLPRKLSGGNRDIRQLFDGGFGNDAAIRHEQNAILAEARVLHLHDHATGSGR